MRKSYLPLIAVIVLAAILYSATMVVLVYNLQPSLNNSPTSNRTPTVNIVLYEGEVSATRDGFGNTSSTLTSPGPTLRFNLTDVVNITVINVGKMPHAFAITSAPKTGSQVLFNAEIGSASNPLQPGKQGTVIFTPKNAGSSFFYICPVPGHAEVGMYGSVIITG
jgi:FtsP/CotA-like multicopper oxidase with cupredoxin domain